MNVVAVVHTVVLMHRAMAHKVAENYSSVLRQAVLYDFDARVGTQWRGEPVRGHEVRTPILDGAGALQPPRHLDDEYWAAQPPLAPEGAPALWAMWGPELRRHDQLGSCDSANREQQPQDRGARL